MSNGQPFTLRIVERFNSSARAVVSPRALLPQVKARPEVRQIEEQFPIENDECSERAARGRRA